MKKEFMLSEVEQYERERLLELQRSKTRWFSREELDRLKELNDKAYSATLANCKHEWISLQATGRLHCKHCNDTRD